MMKNVKPSFLRYDRRCGWVLLAVAWLTVANLLLFWLGSGQRLYFAAALPYYAASFADQLSQDGILRLLVGLCALLFCLTYAACLKSTNRGGFGLLFYGLDTVFLLLAAVCLVENPLSCLPELLFHGLVLLLLCPPLTSKPGRAIIFSR